MYRIATFPGLPGTFRFEADAPDILDPFLRDVMAREPCPGSLELAKLSVKCGLNLAAGEPSRVPARLPGQPTGLVPSACHLAISPGSADASVTVAAGDSPDLDLTLRKALTRMLAAHGVVMLHAALVEVDGGGWLVLGESGRGKSAFATAAFNQGYRIVGDDSLLIYPGTEGAVGATSFRRDLVLRRGSKMLLAEAVQVLLDEVTDSRGEPRWVLRRPQFKEGFADCVGRVDRILILDSSEFPERTRVLAVSATDAFAMLIASASPLFLGRDYPVEAALGYGLLKRVVERAETVRIRPGGDLLEDIRLFDR